MLFNKVLLHSKSYSHHLAHFVFNIFYQCQICTFIEANICRPDLIEKHGTNITVADAKRRNLHMRKSLIHRN